MVRRDPEVVIKQIIVAVMGLVGIVAGGIGVTACIRATAVHGDPPLMLVGVLGSLLGVAAGVYFVWLALNPRRAFPRR